MNILKRWGIYLIILILVVLASGGVGYFLGYRNGFQSAVFDTLDRI